MDDIAVRFEHVHLLDRLDGLHIHLLQCRLQLLVIGAGALVDFLGLSPRRALATAMSHVRSRSRGELRG